MIVLKVITVFVLFYVDNVYSSSCYWNNYNPYRFFATKTPYNNGRSDIRDSAVLKAECKAISIWGLFRHGQRNPGIKYSENIKNVISVRENIILKYEEGKSSLCAQDIDNLRNWQVNEKMFEEFHDTTDDGFNEIFEIAKRFKKAYNSLLEDLKPDKYTFRSSSQQYIRDCVDSFLIGLEQPELIVDKSRKGDVMAAFDDCKRYKKHVKLNQTTFAEAARYLTTEDYLKSMDRIQKRLGLDFELSKENITSLYDLCRYVWSAVDNKPSPWCALFNEEDLKVQEYYEDLRQYYRNGYGHAWNVEFGHIPLADLLQTFRSEKVMPKKKITAYFSHATTLSMVYSALGQFKDEKPLTADYRDENRKWRTSEHALFGGNLVAVLNRCNKPASDDYMVAFYMNEKPLDSVCDHGVCTWEEFEELLRPAENKTFKNVCKRYGKGP